MTDHPRLDRSFTLTRTLAASRHAVFTAWTDSEHLVWFYNPDMPTPSTPIEVDLRVGGTWKQQMVVNDTLSYPTGGTYLEIVPDERLVFRWGAVGGWPELAGENELLAPVVTVQLNDLDSGTRAGTELVLTVQFSERLDINEVQKLILGGTRDGWGATIDRIIYSTAVTTMDNTPLVAEP
ncbi:SRPBCC domain-containing protein [Arthrobacter sp. H5]|uniref:SRPBCC family protein n=1 Tax=Arthrobacter sp. H5 TaxID=1267973 RepID=UPI00138B1933|nr:SRPBCC domain-containing protein [Arthrobacter sp. H5]